MKDESKVLMEGGRRREVKKRGEQGGERWRMRRKRLTQKSTCTPYFGLFQFAVLLISEIGSGDQ